MQSDMERKCERPEELIPKCLSAPMFTGSGLISAQGGYQMLGAGRACMQLPRIFIIASRNELHRPSGVSH